MTQRTKTQRISTCSRSSLRAIEASAFPFEHLSRIAEIESWRKEVNRPIYHIHKWWAQRLGSVFRAILIGAFSSEHTDIISAFYSPTRFSDRTVFDPFMGSGTTIGEALKLGARAIGRDINAVAELTVRSALRKYTKADVIRTFKEIEQDTAPQLLEFFKTQLPDGRLATVLYYFWVKIINCPKCSKSVDLFSSRVFSRHAYPKKYPIARSVCPHCGEINAVNYDADNAQCADCGKAYNPQDGVMKGHKVICPHCEHEFPLAKAAKKKGCPPGHRLYAKMVLLPNGEKQYVRATPYDVELYKKASKLLKEQIDSIPDVAITEGYNTDQVLNYGYTHWRQMFNDRQLLCICLLFNRLRQIKDAGVRQLLEVHLSGVLEFNNMFTSFKGEGTGAVRHMFSHHILKPERTPLEANLWGTPKSSGSFSTLFESRILRALEYRENPFELQPVADASGKTVGEKVFGLSDPMGYELAMQLADFTDDKILYLSCGDSSKTDLADESVDAVVTDPPFFDNVHYSQLADFFYVWLRQAGHDVANGSNTTRSDKEVQHTDAATFATRLGNVLRECHRVLKKDGLLVFSYHHSRNEGWDCVLTALVRAGFVVSAVQPIKAEMSGAAPKAQASEPIDIDIIVVCRKRIAKSVEPVLFRLLLDDAVTESRQQITRFNRLGRRLSRNDVRVVFMSQLMKRLSTQSEDHAQSLLDDSCEPEIQRLYTAQEIKA